MSTLDRAFRKAYQKNAFGRSEADRNEHPVVPAPHVSFASTDSMAAPAIPEPLVQTAPPLRPVYEVAQFTWPSAVERVLDLGAAGLNVFADRILAKRANAPRVLVFSGLGGGVGTSTACLSLARSLANRSEVALVDANFANPQLGQALGLAPQTGWEDVLSDLQPLAEALIESALDRLTLLPICQASGWTALAVPMAATLAALAARYELICVDVGPTNREAARAWSDCLRIVGLAAQWLLVIDARLANDDAVQSAVFDLAAAGVAECELIENFASTRHV